MSERLELLTEKIEEVLKRLEQLKMENVSLKSDSNNQKSELITIKKEYDRVVVEGNDRTELFRSRLTTILQRLDQLENLTE